MLAPEAHSYSAYGMGISSFMPLPGLVCGRTASDIVIRKGRVRESRFFSTFDENQVILKPELNLSVRAGETAFCIEWNGLGRCLIRQRREIVVEPDRGVDPEALAPYITGPALAVLLHQRNLLVLHASAVAFGDSAAVFLGNKGYGKSTQAAHLEMRSHPLVSDDLVPVSFRGGVPETSAGYPQIKLYDDSLESIGLGAVNMPLVTANHPKRFMRCEDHFADRPLSVGCVFILENSDSVEITRLPATAAFMGIARNSYMGGYLAETNSVSAHFQQCQALVNSTPIFQLRRPRDFGYIAKVTDLIERTMSELVTHR
jgi:hypothetical protein